MWFIPGIIAFIVIDNLTVHRETKIHHWIIYSLILGTTSYMFLEIIAFSLSGIYILYLEITTNVVYNIDMSPQVMKGIIDPDVELNFFYIIVASIIAFYGAKKIAKMINDGEFFRYAQKQSITRKISELDAWENFKKQYMNEDWIRVRDIERNRCYQGHLEVASDAIDRDGIVLNFVDVYQDSDGSFLYSTKALCLPRKLECLIIELPEKSSLSNMERQVNSSE
jgi:hypothetical protein